MSIEDYVGRAAEVGIALYVPETFESDVALFGRVLEEYRADVAAAPAQSARS